MFNSANIIEATNKMLSNYNDSFRFKEEGKLEAATNSFNRSVMYSQIILSNLAIENISAEVYHGKDLSKYVFAVTTVARCFDSIIEAIVPGNKIAEPFIDSKNKLMNGSRNIVNRYFEESTEKCSLGHKYAVMRGVAEAITSTLGDVGRITTFKAVTIYSGMKDYWKAA